MGVTRVEDFYEPGNVAGNAILGNFLRSHFPEDRKQQSSFDEGFNSLRRKQLEILAGRVGLKVGTTKGCDYHPDTPKYAAVLMFDAWVMQGRIDIGLQGPMNGGMAGVAPKAEIMPESYDQMSWPQLRLVAASAGVKSHGMDRDQIVAALIAMDTDSERDAA